MLAKMYAAGRAQQAGEGSKRAKPTKVKGKADK